MELALDIGETLLFFSPYPSVIQDKLALRHFVDAVNEPVVQREI